MLRIPNIQKSADFGIYLPDCEDNFSLAGHIIKSVNHKLTFGIYGARLARVKGEIPAGIYAVPEMGLWFADCGVIICCFN